MAKSTIVRKKKPTTIPEKMNIAFSGASHKLLREHCKLKGYNLGAFCETAALDRALNETTADKDKIAKQLQS